MASQNASDPQAANGGGGGGGPPGGQGGGGPEEALKAMENVALSRYLLVTIGGICAVLLAWRIGTFVQKHVRTIVCLNNEKQRYFAIASPKLAFFKRNVLCAPIFRVRHNREIQLSSAVNVGTLPTRLELFLLLGYFATNVAFCVAHIPFAESFSPAARAFRDRTGNLAVINMIPLFLFAGRNNPLIGLLGISFDTFNLAHRLMGRVVILESLAHSIAHLMLMAQKPEGWGGAFQTTFNVPYIMFGFLATCAFLAISIQANSPVRHAFYEVFKLLHVGLAILALVGLFYHLQLKGFPQVRYLGIIIPFWVVDRVFRIGRLIYGNLGNGGTRTVVEALPGSACRVTVTLARSWGFRPGQHAYLYMPSVGFWQSHPFSVAWTEEATDTSSLELPKSRDDGILSLSKTSVSFVVRARTGFTNALYNKAVKNPDGRFTTTCFVEGPYGGLHGLASYGTVVLFAGGVGITHQVPYIRDLVAGYSNGTVAARKVVLIWAIQSPDHLEWIRPWMTDILALERRREVLRIMLFISQPRSTKEIHSPSATVQMFPGRPNIETLLNNEVGSQVGAMCVSVCGPGSLSDAVRKAVRQHRANIDYVEEAFSW